MADTPSRRRSRNRAASKDLRAASPSRSGKLVRGSSPAPAPAVTGSLQQLQRTSHPSKLSGWRRSSPRPPSTRRRSASGQSGARPSAGAFRPRRRIHRCTKAVSTPCASAAAAVSASSASVPNAGKSMSWRASRPSAWASAADSATASPWRRAIQAARSWQWKSTMALPERAASVCNVVNVEATSSTLPRRRAPAPARSSRRPAHRAPSPRRCLARFSVPSRCRAPDRQPGARNAACQIW